MLSKHLLGTLLVTVSLMTAGTGRALDLSKGYPSEADDMDKNRDGMISKDEYLRFHTEKFEKMQNSEGLVAVEDMVRYLRGPGGETR